MLFDGATFSDGEVAYTGATFSGGSVTFGGAQFTGGTLDLARAVGAAPGLPQSGAPVPPGLRLPPTW
ncbi:pentapeptide repeat-containing protein [Streptomyces coeruleorubidus]|uniref:pentapeptide repeat-containing protein n=1 Tax=Streptomyces coeruleorubidus TaxID=116188 RepID=UPI001873C3C5|nr:hypothetical protein GCM10010244_82280 [Streptomyces bellus]